MLLSKELVLLLILPQSSIALMVGECSTEAQATIR